MANFEEIWKVEKNGDTVVFSYLENRSKIDGSGLVQVEGRVETISLSEFTQDLNNYRARLVESQRVRDDRGIDIATREIARLTEITDKAARATSGAGPVVVATPVASGETDELVQP